MRTTRAGGSREAILTVLGQRSFADAQGRATGLLFDAIDYQGSTSGLSQLLTAMEADGLIERTIVGKRCYEIRLADPDAPRAGSKPESKPVAQPPARSMPAELPKNLATIASSTPPPVLEFQQRRAEQRGIPQAPPPESAIPAVLRVTPAAAPVERAESPVAAPAGISAQAIAAALLDKVLEQAARPLEFEDTKTRLAAALDEAQRLRTRVREAEDLAAARQQEIAGLRQRLGELQRTLDQIASNGDFRITETNLRRLRELTALMTQAPTRR